MLKLSTVVAIIFFSLSSNSDAANEQLIKEYLSKSGFRAEIERSIRTSNATLSAAQLNQFINFIDFKKIEQTYIKTISEKMSNDEVQALIQAQGIPGFKSAAQKQLAASGAVIEVIVSELENAGKKIKDKNK